MEVGGGGSTFGPYSDVVYEIPYEYGPDWNQAYEEYVNAYIMGKYDDAAYLFSHGDPEAYEV